MAKPNDTRFASMSEDDMKKLLYDKDSKNTHKGTEQAVRLFRAYLTEKKMDTNFEKLPKNELDTILARFYAEARQKSGELYKKTSLNSIRHGLNRHLSDLEVDIIKGSDFAKSQLAFQAVCADLKRQGAGGIDHHPPIEDTDLQLLYKSFDICNPESLQSKVFVDIMLHFGRRGRENLRDLCIQDFALTSDGDGLRYIYICRDEKTKNHQSDTNTACGSMYEIPDQDEMCPVKTFVKYKRLLPPGNTHLFPRPLTSPTTDGYYFSRQTMGHNKLGTMMSTLSKKAKLSKIYTNHSLRATSVHVLDSASIPSRHIMCVTGHKAESSLKTYSGYTDNKTKKVMSHTISKSLGLSVRDTNHEEVKKGNETQVTPLQPLTDSQFDEVMREFNDLDDPINDLLLSIPPVSCQTQGSVVSSVYTQSGGMPMDSLPAPMISGSHATVNINYNFFGPQGQFPH